MSVDAQLRVGETWLGGTGLPFGDLAWTDRADGGNFEATWSLIGEYGQRPAPLYRGAPVEVYLGPTRRWCGSLTICDWDDGTFTAQGMSQSAYNYGARSGLGVTTSTPDIAIDEAIASDGWAVRRTSSFSAAPVIAGDVTDDLNNVGAILDQSALTQGLRWGVWGDGVIRTYGQPQDYDYLLAPGVIELGETSEGSYTKVIARYIDSGTGQRANVGAGGGFPVLTLLQDLTNLGPISAATATAIAQNVLALGGGAPGWTNGVDVSSAQILTRGGTPAELATVTASQVLRLFVSTEGGTQYRDLVIGETKYESGSDVLSLSPVEKAASTVADVIEDTYTRLTGQPVKA